MRLETERLIIREMDGKDIEPLYTLLSTPEVMRYSVSGVKTVEQTITFLQDTIDSYSKQTLAMWGVLLKGATINSEKMIGICGFYKLKEPLHAEYELGYRLLPRLQGQGYATEAATAVRNYAFKNAIKTFVAVIEPNHQASIRVCEKIGMQCIGLDTYHGLEVKVYLANQLTI